MQLGKGEDGVLREEAVGEESLASVDRVLEAEHDGSELLEPVDVGQVAPLRSVVVDHDEEVQVRVIVESLDVATHGTEAEERYRVATLREHGSEVIETFEETLRDAQSGSQPST